MPVAISWMRSSGGVSISSVVPFDSITAPTRVRLSRGSDRAAHAAVASDLRHAETRSGAEKRQLHTRLDFQVVRRARHVERHAGGHHHAVAGFARSPRPRSDRAAPWRPSVRRCRRAAPGTAPRPTRARAGDTCAPGRSARRSARPGRRAATTRALNPLLVNTITDGAPSMPHGRDRCRRDRFLRGHASPGRARSMPIPRARPAMRLDLQ